MANRHRREALRGAEGDIFDILAEVLTTTQWTRLLKGPLERAARHGNRGLAQKLVGAGAEIGEALFEAVLGGNGDIVNDLVEGGASMTGKEDSSGYTPIHLAAESGKTEMVKLLLLKGADKDALNENQQTPLYLAVAWRNVAAALALMAAGADVNLRCGEFEDSVLHQAAEWGHVDIMAAAIERGADVNAADTRHRTPLHCAATQEGAQTIDALVEAGANIDARDGGGRTPLHGAAGEPSLAAVLALLKHGADANAQDKLQDTPLHWVAGIVGSEGAVDVVDSLLRAGADETILNDEGEAAAGEIAVGVEDESQVAEDNDRVRELLVNAPADRAWRRRGYLVMCRAHPHRVQHLQDVGSEHAGMAPTARSGAKLARAEAGGCSWAVDASPVDGRGIDDWAVVVAKTLGVQEEGIFRTIVGYL